MLDDEGPDDEVDDLIRREAPLPCFLVRTDHLESERRPDSRTAEHDGEGRELPRSLPLPEQDERAEDEDQWNVRIEIPQVEGRSSGLEEAADELVADVDLIGFEEVEAEHEDDRPGGQWNEMADDTVPHLRFGARRRTGEHGPTGDHEEHRHGPGVDRLGEMAEPPGIAAFVGTADEDSARMAEHDGESGEHPHDVDVVAMHLRSPRLRGRGLRLCGRGCCRRRLHGGGGYRSGSCGGLGVQPA